MKRESAYGKHLKEVVQEVRAMPQSFQRSLVVRESASARPSPAAVKASASNKDKHKS